MMCLHWKAPPDSLAHDGICTAGTITLYAYM